MKEYFDDYDKFEEAQIKLHAEGKTVETCCNPKTEEMWIEVQEE